LIPLDECGGTLGAGRVLIQPLGAWFRKSSSLFTAFYAFVQDLSQGARDAPIMASEARLEHRRHVALDHLYVHGLLKR
jgi:hypothetical protein